MKNAREFLQENRVIAANVSGRYAEAATNLSVDLIRTENLRTLEPQNPGTPEPRNPWNPWNPWNPNTEETAGAAS